MAARSEPEGPGTGEPWQPRLEIERVDFGAIEPLRERFRGDAGCQIVHDSILPRGLADAWILRRDGKGVGYGGVWNRYFPGRVVEFCTMGASGHDRLELFEAFLSASGAREIEAQTNMPDMDELLARYAPDATEEKVLFEDGSPTSLDGRGARVRRRRDDDDGPEGEWVLEAGGAVVAAGGVMTHYNPPFGDLYMAVVETARRRGFGSFLVQELRRICRESGLVPAARCDPDNLASRRTLERGGMVVCGTLRAGPVRAECRLE